ncbi:MAG: hypothetical protein AB7S99_22060 [Pseudodonghicola sp.]
MTEALHWPLCTTSLNRIDTLSARIALALCRRQRLAGDPLYRFVRHHVPMMPADLPFIPHDGPLSDRGPDLTALPAGLKADRGAPALMNRADFPHKTPAHLRRRAAPSGWRRLRSETPKGGLTRRRSVPQLRGLLAAGDLLSRPFGSGALVSNPATPGSGLGSGSGTMTMPKPLIILRAQTS